MLASVTWIAMPSPSTVNTEPATRRPRIRSPFKLTTPCVCVLSHFSSVRFSATLWTVAHQVPPSMGFSRREYCSGLPCPPPGDPPGPGIEPASLTSPALAGRFFTTSATWEAQLLHNIGQIPSLRVLTRKVMMSTLFHILCEIQKK